MDAQFVAPILILVLLALLGLSATLGVDSRDGFADDRLGHAHR